MHNAPFKSIAFLFILLSGLLVTGCDNSPTGSIEAFPEEAISQEEADQFVLDAKAPTESALRDLYFSEASKRGHRGGIVHRQLTVRVGPGPFDVVRIHRVVRERRPFHPIRTKGAVFMVHGSSQDFDDIFFTAGADDPTTQTSIPLYLASKNIDVWGIDLGWTMVPIETTDFSFMQDWGVERDVDHTLTALSIARLLRGLTGQGFGRVHLLGFSYGAAVAYIAAGHETQQPWFLRDIKGLLPVDFGLKVGDEARQQAACMLAAADREAISNGTFNVDNRGALTISDLAATAPDEDSDIIPGFTNYQAALFIATNPGVFWQFAGVEFDANNLPVDLLYSDPDRWIALLGVLAPYMPLRGLAEIGEARCDEVDVSIDDYLSQITLPIFYLGAGGGFGAEEGEYTTSLTASNDVTIHEVSVQSEADRAIDFGHADLFLGDDARNLAWKEVYRWLAERDE